MVSNVSLVYVGVMICRARENTRRTIYKKRDIHVFLIWLNASSLSILHGFFTRSPDKKNDDLISTALLEALTWQFIYFGENDVCLRHFQRGRIGGPGRGYFNLLLGRIELAVPELVGKFKWESFRVTKINVSKCFQFSFDFARVHIWACLFCTELLFQN